MDLFLRIRDFILNNPKKLVNKCRYPGDKNLQKELLKDKKIKSFLKSNKKSFQTASDHSHQIHLSHSLQVTPKSSPYLFEIVDKCLSVIDLKSNDINVFIISNQHINAWCSKTKDRVDIGLHSGLINSMEFDELCFIVGHEFGHALYDHHRLPAYGISQELRLPPSKLLKLMSWSRQSEISADRAGMLCSDSLEASVQALIKLSTGGIGRPVISFDVEEFENQLSDIDSFIDENSDLMYTTHPLNPFRVRALIEFSNLSEICSEESTEAISLDEVDSRIDALIEKMNPSKIKKDKKAGTKSKGSDLTEDLFVLHAGFWVLSADGVDKDNKELASLADIVGDDLVKGLDQDRESSYKEIIKSGKFAKKLKKPQKCRILESLVTIARADGEISTKEKEALNEVAEILQINPDFIDQVLRFLD